MRGCLWQYPLIISSYHGHTEIVKILLDRGADKNAKNTNGENNSLMLACANDRTETAILLLEYGVDVDTKNKYGFNPLLFASFFGKHNNVELLLIYVADINVYNKIGESCLDFECGGVWKENNTQELIITKQSHNIKLFDDKIGILPSLKKEYKDIIELVEMGLF